jgi:hypothetical protein
MGNACGTYGKEERCIPDIGDATERKSPFARPQHRYKDKLKIGLKEMCWNCVEWIDLARDGNKRRFLTFRGP